MSDIGSLVSGVLVSHTAFTKAKARIDACLRFSQKHKHDAICQAVLGEARTGKSSLLRAVLAEHPEIETEHGWIVPVLSALVPAKPTPVNLVEEMLERLHAKDAFRGSLAQKTIRLKHLLEEEGTKMLMLDDFQHFVDQGTQLVMQHVADYLKNLVEATNLPLIVNGLPNCRKVIDMNQQLAGRFMAPVYLPRFNWAKDEDRQQFQRTLGSFYAAISPKIKMVPIYDEDYAFRFWCATGGLIGYIAKILREAVWDQVLTGRRKITLRDLDDAHAKAIWFVESQNSPRPFRQDFSLELTLDLVKSVGEIGTRPPQDEEPAIPRVRRRRKVALSEILTAA